MSVPRKLVIGLAAASVAGVLCAAGPVSAHPLGNFSVNHAHALHLTSGRVVDEAVIDTAEIPTAQAEAAVDTDRDGAASSAELAAYGERRCAELLADLELAIDGEPVRLATTRTSFTRLPGTAGLDTSRLECRFEAAVDLDAPASVSLRDDFETDRVGWHEITATSDGVTLVDPSVPAVSPTGSLRDYPVDLLASPLLVRAVTLDVRPGGVTTAAGASADPSPSSGRALTEGGPLAGVVDGVERVFDDLVGHRELTLGVGLAAVALAMILGASHALLPGHGKTVMAAYIAGRQGTSRDAVLVGATVTATHTGGVLLLGLALTVSSSLAGEQVVAWLGVGSGAIVAALGASLLVASFRRRGSVGELAHGHRHGGRFGHTHGPVGDHGHDDGQAHDHDHGQGHGHTHDHPGGEHATRHRSGRLVRARPATRSQAGATVETTHRRAVSVTARPRSATSRPLTTAPVGTLERAGTSIVRAAVVPRRATESVDPPRRTPRSAIVSRRGLVGMGIAGGLVPSPSALVVLLSAIALGRTAFGVLLVVGYGVGMAGTLTLAGLLMVRIRDRWTARATRLAGTAGRAAARWRAVAPFATAALVLVVGLGLAIRSLGQIG